jgi:hypothetical protein
MNMQTGDFPTFRGELNAMAVVFSKVLEDSLVQMYWDALKDQSLAGFKERCRVHLKKGKFFPKPAELRPKEEKEQIQLSANARRSVHLGMLELAEKDPRHNGYLKSVLKQNAKDWLERFAEDYDKAAAEYSKARYVSDIGSCDPDSPEHAEIIANGPYPINWESVKACLVATIKRCES